MKSQDVIEVEVYFNNIVTEENYPGFSSGTYNSQKNEITEFAVTTNDKSIASLIKGYTPIDQKDIIEKKLSEIRKRTREQRIQLSENNLHKITDKLKKSKLDNIVKFNKSAGILKARFTKSEVLELSKYPQLMLSISLPKKIKPLLASAFNETRLNTTGEPVSVHGGQGVGIYMSEIGCFDEDAVMPVETLIGLGGGGYTEDRSTHDHATMVAQCLRMASPRSHIYCSDDKYSIPNAYNNNVHIINYSAHVTGEEENDSWTSMVALIDRHSYYDRVQPFIPAGNDCSGGGCKIGGWGVSHNALTVGAYIDGTDTIADFSDWKNPQTGATKPEILAPGYLLQAAGNLLNNDYDPPLNWWSGTSFASPIAAGISASNASLIDIRNHPALIKASTIAMATKDNITNNGNSQRNGASAVQWNPYGWYWWWDYPNSFLDSADWNWMELKEFYLYGGNKIKAILSWSNREDICDGNNGSYNGPSNHLCMNLDFKVIDPNGVTKVYSTSANNNWEGNEFTASTSGNYKFHVRRSGQYYEWTGSGSNTTYHKNRVRMGLRVAYISNE